jgi:putative oxygen-independent coproporphyrinogen III oxidase
VQTQLTTSLYIHWPFCKSKCPYCDFNSHVANAVNEADWLQAFLNELEYFSPKNFPAMQGKKIASIFFGGGTPSLMPPSITAKLIERAEQNFGFIPDVEISLEANPTSAEASKFAAFKAAGVNRISIGVQALNEADLKFLGRQHSASEALDAIELAAKHFDNYNFDLIYARPNQSVEAWAAELQQALRMGAKHMSLYQLTIEKGTKFYSSFNAKEFSIPNSDEAAKLYEATADIMNTAKMPAYEVSNYALAGFECKHNLNYWNYGEYIGIGAGAHGRVLRYNNTPNAVAFKLERAATMMWHAPDNWLKAALEKGVGLQTNVKLSDEEVLEEFLIMTLRLFEGVELKRFEEVFGKPYTQVLNQKNLNYLLEDKFLEIYSTQNPTHLKATKSGMLLLQSIVPKLLP